MLLVVPLTLWVAVITVVVVLLLVALVEIIAGPRRTPTVEQVPVGAGDTSGDTPGD